LIRGLLVILQQFPLHLPSPLVWRWHVFHMHDDYDYDDGDYDGTPDGSEIDDVPDARNKSQTHNGYLRVDDPDRLETSSVGSRQESGSLASKQSGSTRVGASSKAGSRRGSVSSSSKVPARRYSIGDAADSGAGPRFEKPSVPKADYGGGSSKRPGPSVGVAGRKQGKRKDYSLSDEERESYDTYEAAADGIFGKSPVSGFARQPSSVQRQQSTRDSTAAARESLYSAGKPLRPKSAGNARTSQFRSPYDMQRITSGSPAPPTNRTEAVAPAVPSLRRLRTDAPGGQRPQGKLDFRTGRKNESGAKVTPRGPPTIEDMSKALQEEDRRGDRRGVRNRSAGRTAFRTGRREDAGQRSGGASRTGGRDRGDRDGGVRPMQGTPRRQNMPPAQTHLPHASMEELKHLPPPDELVLDAVSNLIGLGFQVEEIAEVFNISEDTVCDIMDAEAPMERDEYSSRESSPGPGRNRRGSRDDGRDCRY